MISTGSSPRALLQSPHVKIDAHLPRLYSRDLLWAERNTVMIFCGLGGPLPSSFRFPNTDTSASGAWQLCGSAERERMEAVLNIITDRAARGVGGDDGAVA